MPDDFAMDPSNAATPSGQHPMPATPGRAHAINARQLQDLTHLEDLLERAGIDVAGHYGANRVGGALVQAREALEELHDALRQSWDASLTPAAARRRRVAVEPTNPTRPPTTQT